MDWRSQKQTQTNPIDTQCHPGLEPPVQSVFEPFVTPPPALQIRYGYGWHLQAQLVGASKQPSGRIQQLSCLKSHASGLEKMNKRTQFQKTQNEYKSFLQKD